MRRSLLYPRLHAVRLDGTSGCFVSTPDHADLDIVGDIDIRVAVIFGKVPFGVAQSFVSKFVSAGEQRSYSAGTNNATSLRLVTTPLGTTDGQVGTNLAFPARAGNPYLYREVRDIDNGAAGNDAIFGAKSYRPGLVLADLNEDSRWATLGTVTAAGTTSLFSGSANVGLGSSDGGTLLLFTGRILAAVIKSGINGTTVAEFDASRMRIGDTTYTDRFGKIWTLHGTAQIAAA